MKMKIGCCAGIEYYDLLVQTGYDTITLPARDIAAMDEAAYREVRKIVAGGPLGFYGFNMFCGPELKLNGKFFKLQAVMEYTKHLLERAAGLGAKYIGIGGPLSRNVLPDEVYEQSMQQFQSALEAMCRLAQPCGIDILLEAITSVEGNFLTTVRETCSVVREMQLPNLHLVYDIYHEFTERQPLDAIREAGGEIRTVHLAQNVGNSRHYLDDQPRHIEEYRAYLSALHDIGYTGEVSMESMVGDHAAGITRSYPILKEILTQLGG